MPTVAKAFAKDFVDVKIDIDRMPHGKDVQARLRGAATGGIPWSVILDADGQQVITADGPEGNIGCPARPHEIEHFMTMMRTGRKHMTDADLGTIQEKLEAYAKKLLGG